MWTLRCFNICVHRCSLSWVQLRQTRIQVRESSFDVVDSLAKPEVNSNIKCKRIMITKLPTSPTNADHALRQWIEIRIQNESESRFAQIEYGPSHLRGRQWSAMDRQKYIRSNPGPFPLQMQSSVLSVSPQGISLRSRRQSKCGKGYFAECGLRKVVKG